MVLQILSIKQIIDTRSVQVINPLQGYNFTGGSTVVNNVLATWGIDGKLTYPFSRGISTMIIGNSVVNYMYVDDEDSGFLIILND